MLENKLAAQEMNELSENSCKLYQILKAVCDCSIIFSSDSELLTTDENYCHSVILDAFFESLWGFALKPTVVAIPDSMSSYLSNLWKVSKERQDCLNDRMIKQGTFGRELFSIEDKLDYYAKVIECGSEETAYLKKLYAYHAKTCREIWKMLQRKKFAFFWQLYEPFDGFDLVCLDRADVQISKIIKIEELPIDSSCCSWSCVVANASYYGAKMNVML